MNDKKKLNKSVCLCITNFNKEKSLDRAIRSCQSQIQQNFNLDIILVNDGSKNFNKKLFLAEYKNIRIISYKKNKGVSYASNVALKNTQAEYFMRVDADDFLSMRACILLTSILDNNPTYPFAYGDLTKIEKFGSNKIVSRKKINQLLEHGAGIMFRTKILKKINGYNNKLRNCEDFELILRVIKRYGKGFYFPVPYYRYYKNENNHLTNEKNRSVIKKQLIKKYVKYL